MRRVSTFVAVAAVAMLAIPAGALAAPAPRPGQISGGLQGVAKDAAQQNLGGVRVQVRSPKGQLVASGTTNRSGEFAFAGLSPDSYTIEVMDAAGNVVGTSAMVSVASGATATITVTAAAAGAITAAGTGGVSLFGFGTIGTVAVVGGATAATIATVVATKKDASPSR